MKKIIKYTLVSAIIGCILFFITIYIVVPMIFSIMFLSDTGSREQIAEVQIPHKKYTIKLYYSAGNATTINAILVAKSINDKDSILKFYEVYDKPSLKDVDYKMLNDSTLQLTLYGGKRGSIKIP